MDKGQQFFSTTYVSCSECKTTMKKKSFAKHWRICQLKTGQIPVAYAVPAMSLMQSQLVPLANVAPSIATSTSVSGSAMSIDSQCLMCPERLPIVYTRATQALLKQHHQYTEDDLMEFLAKVCPEVPESQRQALIYGATTAAQSVARLHVLCDGARTGNDPSSKGTAEAAQRSLSFYNFGLMSRNYNDPLPQVVNMPSVPVTSAPSEMVTATITTDGIPLMNIPMTKQELNRMQEDEESDSSEDDLGLSPPSIEIVEDQPRSAQRPPNPERQPKKKRRECSRGKELQISLKPEGSKKSMNLDDRIQSMIQESEPRNQLSPTQTQVAETQLSDVEPSEPPARHSMPPRVEAASDQYRRGVPPYIPESSGLLSTATYRPTVRDQSRNTSARGSRDEARHQPSASATLSSVKADAAPPRVDPQAPSEGRRQPRDHRGDYVWYGSTTPYWHRRGPTSHRSDGPRRDTRSSSVVREPDYRRPFHDIPAFRRGDRR